MKKLLLLGIALISLSQTSYLYAATLKDQCDQRTQELGQILLSINNKIMAMPPLATIYSSTSNVWTQARSARDAGNYGECIRLNDIGIKTAGVYAN